MATPGMIAAMVAMLAGMVAVRLYGLLKALTGGGGDARLLSCELKPEYFDGRVVWVTGASSGIGKAFALQLMKLPRKWRRRPKLVLSSRSRDALEDVKRTILEETDAVEGDVEVVALDLSDFDKVQSVFHDVIAKQHVHILVNCGGIGQFEFARKSNFEVFKRILDVDFLGHVMMTQEYMKHLTETKRRGHVVQVSSIAGSMALPNCTGYCAAKSALDAYSEALRIELKYEGLDKYVAITNILPGAVATPIIGSALTGDGSKLGGNGTYFGMKAERCADLMQTAISNRLPEVPICNGKELLSLYMSKYLPKSMWRSILNKVCKKLVAKHESLK